MTNLASSALASWMALSALACTARLGAEDERGRDPPGGGGGAMNSPSAGDLGGASSTGGSPGSGGGSADRPSVAPTEFQCDESVVVSSPPLRRLTHRQYLNTVRDILGLALGTAEGELAFSELSESLGRVIPDERAKVPEDLHGSYRRLDQRVQQAHVDAYFETAKAIATVLTAGERFDSLLGSCGDAPSEEEASECISDFIERFGAWALRRPLSSTDSAFYRTFYAPSTGIDRAGVIDVITGLLNAPEFLYLVEHGQDDANSSGTVALAPYELASRLSYHFWDTMPDSRLFELAETGELAEDDVYAGEIERLWSDRRTHATIREFFHEWMKLEEIPELDRNNDAAVFQNFAGENLPSAELRASAQQEILDLLDYFTWTSPSSVDEIFLTRKSFTRSAELAAIYGTEPWNGEGALPEFSASRPGILTRAAFLATGTPSTRPIMKGYFIRKNVLCDEIPPPPGNAAASPPELSEDLTTREVVEGLTESGPCAECHQTYLNPLGFATEGFDSLGRARAEQMLFDSEGNLTASKGIDTRSVPQVIIGDPAPSEGPEDLMRLITESGKVEACFARHYFRFSFGRFEGVVSDGCVLEEMRAALVETGSVADMLRTVALTRAFRSRTFSASNLGAPEP